VTFPLALDDFDFEVLDSMTSDFFDVKRPLQRVALL